MKILILHVEAGYGHRKAAEAVGNELTSRKIPGLEVEVLDALEKTNPLFRRAYPAVYFRLVLWVPWLWGFFFHVVDLPWIQPLVVICRRIFNSLNAGGLHAFLKEERFDYVFTTHFMANEVTAALKKTGAIQSKLITAVTDFDVHRIWLSTQTDCYAVASDWTQQKLLQLGVAKEKIRVTGIPVGEQFAPPADRGELKKKLGLKENIFTVLMATGSFGVGPIEDILRILELEDGLQVLVVCGYNRSLAERLRGGNYRGAKILGLVENMNELMAVSDCMVTKPGGLSIAEALVSQLPMIFFYPIPGQETGNVRVLHEYGIGSLPLDVQGVAGELRKLKSSRDAHLTAVKQTQRLARPAAVRDIISLIK